MVAAYATLIAMAIVLILLGLVLIDGVVSIIAVFRLKPKKKNWFDFCIFAAITGAEMDLTA